MRPTEIRRRQNIAEKLSGCRSRRHPCRLLTSLLSLLLPPLRRPLFVAPSLPFSFPLSLSIRPYSWATIVASLCDHASGISREILADDVAMDTAGSDRERRLPRRARIPFLLSPPRCALYDRKCQYPLSRAAPVMCPLTPSYTHSLPYQCTPLYTRFPCTVPVFYSLVFES